MARTRARSALLAATAAAIGVAALTLGALPPRQATVDGRWTPSVATARVRGIYHVHTNRSDGTGSVDEVAQAAGRARLDFVILTDHGDATRAFDPPRYVGSVLVVDAVEVSTRLGHMAVLGLDAPAPYRLAGWPDEVAEDVLRLGGTGIVTHPDSRRRSLSWRAWDVPVRGFEWLNADSEWRDESRWQWAKVAAAYPWRPVEAIASLFDRPSETLARWDRFSREGRFLVALAGADAHARLGFRDEEDAGEGVGWALEVPSYEQVFRALSTVAELDAPFSQQPGQDAARLLRALTRGRSYTVIDGLASPGRFEFYARHDARTAHMGDRLPEGADVTFTVRTLAPAGAEIRLLRNGTVVAASTGLELTARLRTDLAPGEGGAAFRVEVLWPGGGRPSVPWILSNPIFVEPRSAETPGGDREGPAVENGTRDSVGIDLRSCVVEKDPVSSALVTAEESGDLLTLRYHLGESKGAWVALACTPPRPLAMGEAIEVTGTATRPMRLAVQLRAAAQAERRWGRSVVLDGTARRVRVPADSLRAVGPDEGAVPAGQPAALLFVVDRVHGVAGMRAEVRLERLRIVSGAPQRQVRTVSSR